jgi:hypothetical protein
MSDKKITQLTALTGAGTVAADEMVIVDVSDTTMAASGTTKKITLTQLQSAPVSAGTANGVAYLNGSKVLTSGSALTFDGSNLGLGVTPSAWNSTYRAFNIGDSALILSRTGVSINNLELGVNWFRNTDAAFVYKANGFGTNYQQADGNHVWYTAPSGTAGNAISFTQALTLTSDGNLVAGNTTTTFRINATVASGADRDIFGAQISGASNGFTVKWNHSTSTTRVNISNLPTSATGLASGDLYVLAGVLMVA